MYRNVTCLTYLGSDIVSELLLLLPFGAPNIPPKEAHEILLPVRDAVHMDGLMLATYRTYFHFAL